jgi:hypothetical protein
MPAGPRFAVYTRAHRIFSASLHSSNCLALANGYPRTLALSPVFPTICFAATCVEKSDFA